MIFGSKNERKAKVLTIIRNAKHPLTSGQIYFKTKAMGFTNRAIRYWLTELKAEGKVTTKTIKHGCSGRSRLWKANK